MADLIRTADDVADQFEEAFRTLRKLPPVTVQGYFNTWPDYFYEFADLVGQEPQPMRLVPSPAAISRMEETLSWTVGLDPTDGKIVWLRAHGVRWKTICWTVGLQRSAAHEHWLYALCVIAFRLDGRRLGRNLSRRKVIELAGAA